MEMLLHTAGLLFIPLIAIVIYGGIKDIFEEMGLSSLPPFIPHLMNFISSLTADLNLPRLCSKVSDRATGASRPGLLIQ